MACFEKEEGDGAVEGLHPLDHPQAIGVGSPAIEGFTTKAPSVWRWTLDEAAHQIDDEQISKVQAGLGFYTFLETTLVTLLLLSNFITLFSDEEVPGTPGTLATTFLTFVLNLAFALSVLGFLIMHISLVAGNTTTIEAYEKKTTPKWKYNLGRKKNFEQVFGADRRYWFIPAYSEEDLKKTPALQGLDYPTKADFSAQEF
uniref:Probable protein S-acyltransferase 14 n=1 Tax=Elaeis guineensis var. tenera TaxID=51953 RepID=A0A6I9QLV9_ELAGV|nr:probable protein S-acyltransferase 14 [Elaeis guineensis]